MTSRSTGRGTAALFGLLVVLAGLVGAAVLFVMSQRRPEQAVDEFARAPVGCTTTLEFTDTGTFYVFEERSDAPAPRLGECDPVADPQATFGFELRDASGEVDRLADLGLSYEFGPRSGRSVASFEVAEAGRYEIAVVGSELTVVAAIGRDPDESVSDLRRAAIAVGALGLVVGGVLLVLSGRRSRRAGAPDDPPTVGASWQRPDDLEMPTSPPVAHVPPSGPPLAPPGSTPEPFAPSGPGSTPATPDPIDPLRVDPVPVDPAPIDPGPWAPPSVSPNDERPPAPGA